MRFRAALAALLTVLAVLVAGCGATHHAHIWVTGNNPNPSHRHFVGTSPFYATLLHWSGISIASQTGYFVYVNGSQVADVASSPTTVGNLPCGTTSLLTVKAHDGTGGLSAAAGPVSYTAPSCTPPVGCTLNATTGTFAAQYTALTSGQTLCLASGSYGTFTGGTKSGQVIVKPASGASVNMTIDFSTATHTTVTGMTLNNVTLEGTSANDTISDSTIPSSGQIVVLADSLNGSSNLVIDGNTVDNQLCTDFGLAGRIHVEDAGTNNENPLGLTIENNTLSGGTSDGVRLDAGSGIQVLDNTFTQFDDVDPCHTDDIQFAGSSGGDTISGNFFYAQTSVADCSISVFNGADHLTITNNVVAGNASAGCGGTGGGDGAMALYGDEDSVIEHNVLGMPGLCGSAPCDVGLNFANEGSDVAGTGTLFRDNIMTGVSNGDTTMGTTYSENHNDCTDGDCNSTGNLGTSTGDISGTPIFVGGTHPSTWAGFALATGSPGIAAASDGTNMGLELPTNG